MKHFRLMTRSRPAIAQFESALQFVSLLQALFSLVDLIKGLQTP